jgi:hypothetical protein
LASGGALNQFGIEGFLQALNMPSNHDRRHPDITGRIGKAACLDHGDENLHLPEFAHDHAL